MREIKKTDIELSDEVASLRQQLAALRQSGAERQRTADWLSAQNSLLEIMTGGAPLQEVLKRLCLLIEHQVQGRMCSILLLDNVSGTLHAGAAPSLPEEYARALDGLSIGHCAGSCGTRWSNGCLDEDHSRRAGSVVLRVAVTRVAARGKIEVARGYGAPCVLVRRSWRVR